MGRIDPLASVKVLSGAWPHGPLAIICLSILLLVSGPMAAEVPYQVAWSRQIGTFTNDESRSVAVDASGNAYISGYTRGSLAGTVGGIWDAFLTKYDTSGNLLWSRQLGTTKSDFSYSVALDATGNAYISGYTEGALDGTNAGGQDAFVAKYDASGSLVWSRQVGTPGDEGSRGVAVDGSGNAYITGSTWGDLGGPNAGEYDAFLTKFDASGNALWSRQIGTSRGDSSEGVSVDRSGNAYITGRTYGNLAGTNSNPNLSKVFLVKYNPSGDLLWSRQIDTSGNDRSSSVAVDSSGNVYISGEAGSDLGGTSAGLSDAFLVKYDGSGNMLWSRQIGTSENDDSRSVAVDDSGNVYISGQTLGSLGGPNAGYWDSFLAKYDASGNLLWSSQVGTPTYDISYSMALDAGGNAYISGFTDGDLGGINPNPATNDAFLIKFEPIPEPATLALLALGAIAIIRRRRE